MSSADSVTHWYNLLKGGDQDAASPLWERYFRRLVGRARVKLRVLPHGPGGAEDVALSAFASFCRAAKQGRFPRLGNRDDLWRILLVITVRKAAHLIRHEFSGKGGGGKVVFEADLPPDAEGEEANLAKVMGKEPTPEFAAEVAEECRRLLDRLGDDRLRSIAVMRMEGYTVEEIAEKIDVAVSTVHLKLKVIRHRWSQEDIPQ